MKSAALTAPKQFEIIDGSAPPLRSNTDVLIRIGYVGICGSDMHYYREGAIGGEVPEYPFIIGHECSGTVEEVGDDVTRVVPGDVVAIDPAVACGHVTSAGWDGRIPAGISGIYATDKVPERLRVARDPGAVRTGNPDQEDVVAGICNEVPSQLDAVFECCGDQAALDQAVEVVRPGGQILVVGIPAPERVSFAISRLRRKEIDIQNVRRQNDAMQPAIDLLTAEPDLAEHLLSHVFPLRETGRAFDLVDRYADGVVKALIDVSSPDR